MAPSWGRGGPASEPGACPGDGTSPTTVSVRRQPGRGLGCWWRWRCRPGAGSPAAAAAPSASGWGGATAVTVTGLQVGDASGRVLPSSTWSARSPARSSCRSPRCAEGRRRPPAACPDLRLAAAESRSAIETSSSSWRSCGKAIGGPPARAAGAGCQPPARRGASGSVGGRCSCKVGAGGRLAGTLGGRGLALTNIARSISRRP